MPLFDEDNPQTVSADTTNEIIAAVAMLQGGERVRGRATLESIWLRISHAPNPIDECVLAHYLADVQDEPAEELAWDLRALNAAMRCTDAEARQLHPTLSISALLPSLHLNLAEDYWNFKEFAQSRTHLAKARLLTATLSDDGYGRMIRFGIEGLETRLLRAAVGA